MVLTLRWMPDIAWQGVNWQILELNRRCVWGLIRLPRDGRGPTGEVQINTALAEVLGCIDHEWKVYGEPKGMAKGNQQPDILIESHTTNPVIIEAEIDPAVTVEPEARERLGLKLKGGGVVSTSIALKHPEFLTNLSTVELRSKIAETNDFQYAVYNPDRYPPNGWIKGGVMDIAIAARLSSAPTKQVNQYVTLLTDCMEKIARIINGFSQRVKDDIAKLLNQPSKEQTWKMAGLVMSNAMVFYDMIWDKIELEDGRHCKSLANLKNVGGSISQDELINAWETVLAYNYNPIFDVAKDVLLSPNAEGAGKIIKELYKITSQMQSTQMARSADMYGMLFQRVISDRASLASYYTRPESAALLSTLAVPHYSNPIYKNENIQKYRIADFACGTGLLLLSVYRQIMNNYEFGNVGNSSKLASSKLHRIMMEECITGLDVMPIATHLTVSALAMMFPSEVFETTGIKTMPIGHQKDRDYAKYQTAPSVNPSALKRTRLKKAGMRRTRKKKIIKQYRLGSLDLIQNEGQTTFSKEGKELRGTKEKFGEPWSISRSHYNIQDGSCDLIIMNPPFVRATNHAGKHSDSTVPAWAALHASDEDQLEMGKLSTKKFAGTCAHGNAGLASHFIAVSNKKVAGGGGNRSSRSCNNLVRRRMGSS